MLSTKRGKAIAEITQVTWAWPKLRLRLHHKELRVSLAGATVEVLGRGIRAAERFVEVLYSPDRRAMEKHEKPTCRSS